MNETTASVGYGLETVPCPLCGNNPFDIVIHHAKELYNGMNEYFDVVRCTSCGFHFTNPRPTQETIGYFYPDTAGYYQPSKDVLVAAGNGWRVKLQNAGRQLWLGYPGDSRACWVFLAKLLKPLMLREFTLQHTPRWVEDGCLFDVGCSCGHYLLVMRDLGWQVHGLELNEAAVQFARKELGLDGVQQGFIEGRPIANNSIDVIHMSMVLEHLHEPRKSLTIVNAGLKTGGQLIISLPDFSGWEARLFGRYFYSLHVPQHLNHFTPKTLIRMLLETGFEVDQVVHQHVDRDLIASLGMSGHYPWLFRLLLNSFVRRIVVKPLIYLLARLGKTSRMTIYARKK